MQELRYLLRSGCRQTCTIAIPKYNWKLDVLNLLTATKLPIQYNLKTSQPLKVIYNTTFILGMFVGRNSFNPGWARGFWSYRIENATGEPPREGNRKGMTSREGSCTCGRNAQQHQNAYLGTISGGLEASAQLEYRTVVLLQKGTRAIMPLLLLCRNNLGSDPPSGTLEHLFQ